MPEAHFKPCCLPEYPKAQGASNAIILADEEKSEMDNRQATQIEIGWLSGIIDGEGYVGLQIYKTRNRHQSITTELSVTNTDEQIIIKAQKIVQKIGVNPYINNSSYKMKNKPTHKNVWKLVIHRLGTVSTVLEAVIPYLTGLKQERAILVLEYCKSRLSHYVPGRHHNAMTDREAQIVDLCIAKQKRGASEAIRKAQLEQSALCEQIRLRSVEKKREYDAKWQKDNHAKRMEQQRHRRSIEKISFVQILTDDDMVRPFAKA